MERAASFRVRDGREYEGLFPPATGKDATIARDADLSHTLELLPEVARQHHRQAEGIAGKLQGKTRRECAQNIWEFCYGYFRYRRDEPGTEQIRTPARSWADRFRGIDCDCFTVMVSCILLNMRDPESGRRGIPHGYRVTKYPDPQDPDPPFQHIYVVVPTAGGEAVIDPVMDRFNYEVPFIEKIDLPMKLQVLNGIPGGSPPRSVDQLDLRAGLGTTKFDRLERQAAEQGISKEEVLEQNRQKFIQQYGMTPEEYSQKVKTTISNAQAEAQKQEEATLAKLRAELGQRGVRFPPNATRDELLALIRQSPKVSGVSQVVSTINKVNPATVLLRQGLLLGLKKNMFNVSGKLRWALLSRTQATGTGVGGEDYDKLKAVFEKLKSIFFNAGGNYENLTEAITEGGTRREEAVSGLGEVTAAAAIAAATATLTTLAAILKSIKTPATEAASPPGNLDAEMVTATVPGRVPSPEAVRTNLPAGPGESMGHEETTGYPADDPPPRRGLLGWVKANPLPAAGVGMVVVTGGVLIIRRFTRREKPKGKALAGMKRPRPRDKKGRFTPVRIK